jgi:hypothetical protein
MERARVTRWFRAALVVAVTGLGLAIGPSQAAAQTSPDDWSAARVTAAEKSQTRPLVRLVQAAYTSGGSSSLCAVWSEQVIKETFGTRARCRSAAQRAPHRPCKACSYRVFRVLGIYRTASDRKQGRKTVVWGVEVNGDPQLKSGGALEIRLERERGRWTIIGILLEKG